MTGWHDILAPVCTELDIWQQQVRRAELWFRDDDAVERTPALEQLVSLTASHNVPLLLCVVAEATGNTLRDWLSGQSHVRVSVHGLGHHNYAPLGEKSQELGPHRPAEEVCKDLRIARSKLQRLYGAQLSNILVPPWNRIAPEVVRQLPGLGFSAISTFGQAGEAHDVPALRQINTHLDIIDWKGSRGGRDPKWLAEELAGLLARSRNCSSSPIGVLAHHLVHDDLAWRFIKQLFAATSQHPAVRWCAADELVKAMPVSQSQAV